MDEMELEAFQTTVWSLRGKLLQISLPLTEDRADAGFPFGPRSPEGFEDPVG